MTKDETTSKKKTTKKIAIALLTGAAVVAFAVACGRHGKHLSEKMMREHALDHVDDLMDDIDADDTQRARFEALASELVEEAIAMKQAHKSHKQEVLDQLAKGSPNRKVLHAHVDEKFNGMAAFVHRSLDKILDAYETLDDDQKQIVVEKLANQMENH